MNNILAKQNRQVLEQYAWSNVLIALDYDGTLAPIVERPESAAMRPLTRELLTAVSQRYPCIVICGRAQSDALRRLRGIGLREVIGNHGIEPWHATRRMSEQVQRWHSMLTPFLNAHKGVVIENKSFSISVHYRQSREKKKARAAILEAASFLGDVRILGGKEVLNILPKDAPHKGIALERARERLSCDTAIFVGDDESDEDVFGLDQPGRLLSIRVGAKSSSMASYYIRSQADIDVILDALVGLRR